MLYIYKHPQEYTKIHPFNIQLPTPSSPKVVPHNMYMHTGMFYCRFALSRIMSYLEATVACPIPQTPLSISSICRKLFCSLVGLAIFTASIGIMSRYIVPEELKATIGRRTPAGQRKHGVSMCDEVCKRSSDNTRTIQGRTRL